MATYRVSVLLGVWIPSTCKKIKLIFELWPWRPHVDRPSRTLTKPKWLEISLIYSEISAIYSDFFWIYCVTDISLPDIVSISPDTRYISDKSLTYHNIFIMVKGRRMGNKILNFIFLLFLLFLFFLFSCIFSSVKHI